MSDVGSPAAPGAAAPPVDGPPLAGSLSYDEAEGWLVFTELIGDGESGASQIVAEHVPAWFARRLLPLLKWPEQVEPA